MERAREISAVDVCTRYVYIYIRVDFYPRDVRSHIALFQVDRGYRGRYKARPQISPRGEFSTWLTYPGRRCRRPITVYLHFVNADKEGEVAV